MIKKSESVLNSVSLSISLVIVALAVLVALSPVGDAIDRFYLDTLFSSRGAENTPDDIIIVGVDEDSFAEINQQWPWPRSIHARLIEKLYAAGADAVVFDVIFSEESSPEQDDIFAKAINSNRHTLLAMDISVTNVKNYVQEILVKPANSLQVSNDQIGFVNVPTQADGFVRGLNLQLGDNRSISYIAAENEKINCCKQLPDDKSILINYVGPPGTIETVSYYQALDPDKYLPKNIFNNKIVFIGFVTTSVADPTKNNIDHFPMPFSRGDSGYMSGVEIHANSTYNLLHNSYIRELDTYTYNATSILLAIGAAITSLFFTPLIGLVLIVVLVALLSLTSIYLFSYSLVFMPLAILLIPIVSGYMVSPSLHLYKSNKEKRFIQDAFGSFVSPAVVKELLENPNQLSLGGKKVNASVLFLDIAGFTTMSEKFEPEVLINIMNNVLNEITEIVLKHDGMIDKFIGDAVMAVWGAPAERDDHAYRACLAALEIQVKMKEVAELELQVTGAELAARVGVNSGTMVAGNVGGHRRFEYTVHGNDVNVASRLEGANKFYSTEIMIGENTAKLLDGQFELRQLDQVRLKGKKTAIGIFELQALKGALTQPQSLCNQYYAKGRNYYECNQWNEAIENFNKGLSYVRHDGPCVSMIKRCHEFASHPPAEDWAGVYDMTSK